MLTARVGIGKRPDDGGGAGDGHGVAKRVICRGVGRGEFEELLAGCLLHALERAPLAHAPREHGKPHRSYDRLKPTHVWDAHETNVPRAGAVWFKGILSPLSPARRRRKIDSSIWVLDGSIRTFDNSIRILDSSISMLDSSVQELDSSIQELDSSVQVLDSSIQELDCSVQVLDSSIQELDCSCWVPFYNLRSSGGRGRSIKPGEPRSHARRPALDDAHRAAPARSTY